MDTINTVTIVRGGRISVEVPAEDGTGVQVIVIPRRQPGEVKIIL